MISAILFLILFSRISQENSYDIAMFDSERHVLNSFAKKSELLPLAALLFKPCVSTGCSYAWSCGSNYHILQDAEDMMVMPLAGSACIPVIGK